MPSHILPEPDGMNWALFLDLDGTLLEIAAHPDSVAVPPLLVPLLAQLRAGLQGALAIISGRSLASLETLLPYSAVDMAGCHGAEIRFDSRYANDSATALLPQALEKLAERIKKLEGAFIETKSHAVALHYRAADITPAQAMAIAQSVIADTGGRLRAISGKAVVEILPQGASKAAAVQHFLARPAYRGRLPVFVGDDVTDEEAFAFVNSAGGHSVHVGASAGTCAGFAIAEVGGVLAWLQQTVLPRLQKAPSPRARQAP